MLCTYTNVILNHVACKFFTIYQYDFLTCFLFCKFSCLTTETTCSDENTLTGILFVKCSCKSMQNRFAYHIVDCITFCLNIDFVKPQLIFFDNTINAVIVGILCHFVLKLVTKLCAENFRYIFYAYLLVS